MKAFSSQIEIDVPAADAWHQIADFARYPEWNPFLVAVDGELAEGALLTLHVATTPRPLKARIARLVPERELVIDTLWPLGLMRPTYAQTLEPLGERRVRYVNGETFRGPMAWVQAAYLDREVGPYYQEICLALKARLEGGTPDG